MLANSHRHIQNFKPCRRNVENGTVAKLVTATLCLSEKCVNKLQADALLLSTPPSPAT